MRRAAHPGPGSAAAKARGFAKKRTATVAVEFAFIAPILLALVVGAAVFGIAVNNYVTLTGAVRAGARQLAISRDANQPYTDTVAQIKAAAPNLIPANITISVKVGTPLTACTTDAACKTALVARAPAQVIASYPCNLVVMGTNYAPSGCTLTANTTERVE